MKKYILFTFVLVAFLPHLSFAAERISASAISNATLEDGTTATFTIQLDEPIICVDMEATCEVTIPLSVSDDTEGSLDVSEITFDYTEWFTTQTVTVTGVDDDVDDGDNEYSIVLGAAVSESEYYSAFDPADVDVTNTDDDTVGIFVETTTDDTSEDGEGGTIVIVLTSKPTASVAIPIIAEDGTELLSSFEDVVFTPSNWNVELDIPIIALDDNIDDGNVVSSILVGPAESDDPLYNGLEGEAQEFINVDNDTARITISDMSETVSEDGENGTVMISVHTQPESDVTVTLFPNNQATVHQESFTFTPSNWNTPQLLTVRAVDDTTAEDDQIGSVEFVIVSDDDAFAGLVVDPMAFSIVDNDVSVIVDGMYLRIVLDGDVVDQAKVGKKDLDPEYYALTHGKLYASGNYTTIALLKMRKHRTARLVVFRLNEDNTLSKKRVVDFTTPARTPFELTLNSSRKRIRVDVGSENAEQNYKWRLMPNGNLREVN